MESFSFEIENISLLQRRKFWQNAGHYTQGLICVLSRYVAAVPRDSGQLFQGLQQY